MVFYKFALKILTSKEVSYMEPSHGRGIALTYGAVAIP